MKKNNLVLLIVIAIQLFTMPASAKEPEILIDGRAAPLNEKAYIINDRTYVPMRELFETIGATVTWNDKTKSATAAFNDTILSFQIESNTVIKNGVSYWSDSQCKLIDEKTYVPIRIILELLGFNVSWNENSYRVEISTNDSHEADNLKPIPPSFDEGSDNNMYELKVLELINKERNKNGLNSLVIDNSLSNVARMHSRDMAERNFFSHTNPDGLSPFDRMKNYGISYSYAAENIAAGQTSPEDVVNSWMNSQGHRANILNPQFNKIGIGYFNSNKNYNHYWTQCFTN